MPGLRDNFREVLRRYTAGDPMREDVKWTNLTKREIADRLAKTSTPVSVNIVTQLLDDAEFHRRKLRKTLAMGNAPRRNDQVEHIAHLLDQYENSPNPVLSMDTKKKEPLGPYFRPGLLFAAEDVPVAHYPPYTSKYNPIEHRLFPHVTRACAGVSLTDLETAVQLMRKTRTRTGLRVTVEVVKKYYATGQKYSPEFRAAMPLEFDEELPAWNYRAIPAAASDLILN